MSLLIPTFFFLSFLHLLHAVQQSYPSSEHTMDCTRYHTDNAGYLCEPANSTCDTLAYFHVQGAPFSDLNTIATQLFSTNASTIAEASGLSASTMDLNPGEGLYIPSTCTCNGNFTSYNVTYSIRPGDTYLQLANVTYEGLTTCQAMQDANPNYTAANLTVADQLVIPLRCACPSKEQWARGIKLLVTYPVGPFGEAVSAVTDMFGISLQEFLVVNNLTNTSARLFPAITVLLPFLEMPTRPPNASYMSKLPPDAGAGGVATPSPSKRPKIGNLFIAIAIAGCLILLTLIVIASFFFTKKKKEFRSLSKKRLLAQTPHRSPLKVVHAFPTKDEKLKKDLFEGMSNFAIYQKFANYSLEEIMQATQNFHPSKKIKGAVYRGTIKERVVAVKIMKRDVSKELQILQKVNHTSLVSLIGVCIASPEQTYLVYEFAENGSLHDWLHGHACGSLSSSSNDSIAYTLTYRNRLQIALDVATAMEYIHDHTYPSYVHKDMNSHNILLDAKMRGKLANFTLAKETEDMEQTSRHMVGTRGYMAPEYIAHGIVSPKMDVYAYGVVLLEILSGKEAIRGGKGSAKSLVEEIGPLLSGTNAKERLREWIDPCVNGAFPLDCAYNLAIVARSCVAKDPLARSNAREIAFTLSKLLDASQDWEPPSLVENYSHSSTIEAR